MEWLGGFKPTLSNYKEELGCSSPPYSFLELFFHRIKECIQFFH